MSDLLLMGAGRGLDASTVDSTPVLIAAGATNSSHLLEATGTAPIGSTVVACGFVDWDNQTGFQDQAGNTWTMGNLSGGSGVYARMYVADITAEITPGMTLGPTYAGSGGQDQLIIYAFPAGGARDASRASAAYAVAGYADPVAFTIPAGAGTAPQYLVVGGWINWNDTWTPPGDWTLLHELGAGTPYGQLLWYKEVASTAAANFTGTGARNVALTYEGFAKE